MYSSMANIISLKCIDPLKCIHQLKYI